jgi:GTP-binding protein
VHLVDVSPASGRDPVEDFETVQRELASFSELLVEKPMIVVASKMDIAQDPERVAALRHHVEAQGFEFFEISSATGQGIDKLKFAMAERVLVPASAPDADIE